MSQKKGRKRHKKVSGVSAAHKRQYHVQQRNELMKTPGVPKQIMVAAISRVEKSDRLLKAEKERQRKRKRKATQKARKVNRR